MGSRSCGVKIVKGKDRPKKADGTWAFPSKFKWIGYSKMIDLLLEMTEPIHHTGKVVMGNSSFCIAMGVMPLEQFGVHGQFLVKKWKYWPNHVSGDYIEECMATKPLGHTETFIQVIEGKQFLVHGTKDWDYVTKIMSLHWILDKIQDHGMWRLVDGVWKTHKYVEPFSQHNPAKHWVDC